MRQSRRRGSSRRSSGDNVRHIRMMVIPLVIVIVLVIIIVVMDKKPSGQEDGASPEAVTSQQAENSEGQEGSEAGTGESVEPDNNQYTTDFSQYELKKDEVPEVNQIVGEYFRAKAAQDASALYKVFGKAEDDSLKLREEELINEAVYIEDYEEIVCYTKPGLTADSYVAYVTYNVKFRRVDTLAPGLMWCYVLRDGSGNYIIREHVMGEEADYVVKQNQTEDVLLLSGQVNEQLRQAIESDSLLAGIYKELRDGVVVSPSEEEDGEGQDSFVSLEEGEDADAPESAGTPDNEKEGSESTAASQE